MCVLLLFWSVITCSCTLDTCMNVTLLNTCLYIWVMVFVSENREGGTRRGCFLKSFYLAPWQESSINLDIQVYLLAIIMHWVIVRWNTHHTKHKSGRRYMWWLISHLAPDRACGWGFWHLSGNPEETLPLEEPGDRAGWGLAVKKRSSVRETTGAAAIPHNCSSFWPQSAHLWPSVEVLFHLNAWCLMWEKQQKKTFPMESLWYFPQGFVISLWFWLIRFCL